MNLSFRRRRRWFHKPRRRGKFVMGLALGLALSGFAQFSTSHPPEGGRFLEADLECGDLSSHALAQRVYDARRPLGLHGDDIACERVQ